MRARRFAGGFSSAAEGADVVGGDGAGDLGGRAALSGVLFQPTGEGLEDGSDQAAGGDGGVGRKDGVRGHFERSANLLGLAGEDGAAHLFKAERRGN